MMRSLLVYPTHQNIAEERQRFRSQGIPAESYPCRTTSGTTGQPVNCWNAQVDQAESMGFPVVKVVCGHCSMREVCDERGYLAQLSAASRADVALATHQRVTYSGFQEMAEDRSYIAIHESPVQLLRPLCRLEINDLILARWVVSEVTTSSSAPETGGEDQCHPSGGNIKSLENAVRSHRLQTACQTMACLLDELDSAVQQASKTSAWSFSDTIPFPNGFESFLWRITRTLGLTFQGAPWRFLLGALSGEFDSVAIICTERKLKGEGVAGQVKSIVGVRSNPPPAGTTVWFCDATIESARLQQLLNVPIQNGTPSGHVRLQKQIVQYTRDVTRKASQDVVLCLLRGIMAKRCECQRVGLITHRPLLSALGNLEAEFRGRVVRSTYFGSGAERSSNAWHEECDLIVIVGTPRVPPNAIAEYLVQVGELEAACRDGDWGTIHWRAGPCSDNEGLVTSRGYREEHWRAAHRDLVRAALIQAVGRGRGTLETGCDVVVFSNEECGLTVSGDPVPWLNDEAMQVLACLRELSATKPNKESIEKVAVSTAEISQALQRPERTIRDLLTTLEWHGLIYRMGQRSGWIVAPPKSAVQEDTCVNQMIEGFVVHG